MVYKDFLKKKKKKVVYKEINGRCFIFIEKTLLVVVVCYKEDCESGYFEIASIHKYWSGTINESANNSIIYLKKGKRKKANMPKSHISRCVNFNENYMLYPVYISGLSHIRKKKKGKSV